jgi:hypothetical protein
VGAAEEPAATFDTVADDLALAVLANRGELMDCAFEAVEDVPLTSRDYFETQLIVISADFAFCHARETTKRTQIAAQTPCQPHAG